MTKLVPGANDFALLQPLQWNTRYEVEITARNVKGLSEPTFYQFFMPQKPDITGKKNKKKQPNCCFGCFPTFLRSGGTRRRVVQAITGGGINKTKNKTGPEDKASLGPRNRGAAL